MNEEINPNEAPTKVVWSPNTVRLSSTKGATAIIYAGQPKRIPRSLYMEAMKNGCVDYNPQMIQAFKSAIARAENEGYEPTESTFDVMGELKTAIRQVMLAAGEQPELLTADGSPRVAAVRTAFEDACSNVNEDPGQIEVTRELVIQLHQEVVAADNVTRYDTTKMGAADRVANEVPRGADFEGEEVGGDLDDMLSRVAPIGDIETE
jgi:ATP:corrinoid adenosyltransferase